MEKSEFNKKKDQYLAEIHYAYSSSKKLFIDAEEKLSKMGTFLAPLLEHRDSLDHIMRFYEYTRDGKFTEEALRELANARAHEIRAYFDIADYICIGVRAEIASELDHLNGWQIKKVWKDYIAIKAEVASISDEIAAIRKVRIDTLSYIDKYEKVIQKLFKLHTRFESKIKPELKKKYPWRFLPTEK